MSETRLGHALGALTGLAVGDALGMPTQSLPRSVIRDRFGPRITAFEPAPPDHPIARGMARGRVTDDTEQALLLAQLWIDCQGHFDPYEWARRLLAWEDRMRRQGSLDLLGPSTRHALSALQAGESLEQTGRFGTTNGAAMRIAPIGVAVGAEPLPRLVDVVEEVSRITHNTGLAIAGAAAVAAVVSAGVDGALLHEAIELAVRAAALGAARGHWMAGADVATRIQWAVSLAQRYGPTDELLEILDRLVGTSVATQESIPAAFAVLAAFGDNLWEALGAAASVGGDTDTIAALVGAMGGALWGVDALPQDAREIVIRVNQLALEPLAQGLLETRVSARGR
ncbi:MAG: ADP-ribosylglycohydrolase family protein [Firmicutes bacterium]|nr:ADP-ribosylglycohydrolase family protein [Bacillota bacterium]